MRHAHPAYGVRRLAQASAPLAVLCLVVACGSTAQRPGATQAGLAPADPAGDGLAVPVVTSSAVPGPGGHVVTGSGGPGFVPAGDGQLPGTAPSTGAGTTPAQRGITATTVTVGFLYHQNSQALNAAVGAGAIDNGDELQQEKALVADANAHGGLLGRRIQPIYHAMDETSQDSFEVQYQAACADFSQDHHVFAVVAGASAEVFLKCVAKAGIVVLADGFTSAGASTFRSYPGYVEVSAMNLDRIAAAQTAALAGQGYFTGWDAAAGAAGPQPVRVGIVTYSEQPFRDAVRGVLVPALKARGIDVVDVIEVKNPGAASEVGQEAADVSSAVLKLRSDNVSHVMLFESAGNVALFFLKQADSQHYLPRYGFNSQNGIQVLLSGGLVPTSQVAGALGFGWWPVLDLAENPQSGPYSNAARRRCIGIMRAAGVDVSGASAESNALAYCSMVDMLRAAVAKAGDPSARGFVNGVAALGTSFESASTLRTSFSNGKHDGVASYMNWAFTSGCSCFRYSGSPHPVP
ncbi:MAG: hypothetical protein QOE05_2996 [Actinomycetota bacterium]|nr:hypothetical protein [Actinomycetota bacterium]